MCKRYIDRSLPTIDVIVWTPSRLLVRIDCVCYVHMKFISCPPDTPLVSQSAQYDTKQSIARPPKRQWQYSLSECRHSLGSPMPPISIESLEYWLKPIISIELVEIDSGNEKWKACPRNEMRSIHTLSLTIFFPNS